MTTEADFFEAVYAQAKGEDGSVPWQHALSRDFIASWFDTYSPPEGTRALVVAAGLGDDAATLARKGASVTAFDFSPTAVEWAKARHANLAVDWNVADLFDLPDEWGQSFDLIVEVFSIQSIPRPRQGEAATTIGKLLAPGGTLVAVMLIHGGAGEPTGPPWPLDPATVAELSEGLQEVSRRKESVNEETSIALIEWQRGPAS